MSTAPPAQFNLYTLSGCEAFIKQATPHQIAQVLRLDQECVRNPTTNGMGLGTFPTLLIHLLPPFKSKEADEIARALYEAKEVSPSKIEDITDDADAHMDDVAVVEQQQVKIPLVIARLQYTSIIQSIRTHLSTLKRSPHGASLDDIALSTSPNNTRASTDIPPHLIPTDQDFEATLKVLRYLQLPLVKEVNHLTTLTDVTKAVQTHLGFGEAVRWGRMTGETYPISLVPRNPNANKSNANANSHPPHTSQTPRTPRLPHPPRPLRKPRLCYICQFRLTSVHPLYPSLCPPCGSYNISSSSLSLPTSLSLKGKTALVTGGRVNLGYHVVLRLLRCGANVITTTRYPLDAEVRYLKEPDSEGWLAGVGGGKGQLRIVGADFRTAKDVFGLIAQVKKILKEEWDTNKLDILINNAAQTLTDSVEKEEVWIRKEAEEAERVLREGDRTREFVVDHDYKPRVRGGLQNMITFEREKLLTGGSIRTLDDDSATSTTSSNASTTTSATHEENQLITPQTTEKSSWMQRIDEIPYEDVISAHSVNTFVPLILLRELVPYMGRDKSTSKSSASTTTTTTTTTTASSQSTSTSTPIPPTTSSTSTSDSRSSPKSTQTRTPPSGYIINVSSRESLPERTPSHSSKAGHHVHTNMSKAALNMLTETEAGVTWRNWRVCVNSVDPGYMSADKDWMDHLAERRARGRGRAATSNKPKSKSKKAGSKSKVGSKVQVEGEDMGVDEEQERVDEGPQAHQGIPFCPLDWEDGAGRVLWVIAKGEKEGVCVWGRFLKHFESVHSGR